MILEKLKLPEGLKSGPITIHCGVFNSWIYKGNGRMKMESRWLRAFDESILTDSEVPGFGIRFHKDFVAARLGISQDSLFSFLEKIMRGEGVGEVGVVREEEMENRQEDS